MHSYNNTTKPVPDKISWHQNANVHKLLLWLHKSGIFFINLCNIWATDLHRCSSI